MTYHGPPVPATPAMPPAPRSILLGDLLVLVGGLLVFAFSFAPFVQYAEAARGFLADDDFSGRFNAWSFETFMAPLTNFVVFAALLGIAAVVVRFVLRRDPHLVGFRLRQLEVGMALFMVLVLFGMTASSKTITFGVGGSALADLVPVESERLDVGWGAVLMLVGAIVALAGAVLNHVGVGPRFTVGRTPMPPPPPPPPG